ncbi:TetR/AcrR family transcriptional regulator [Candidatus Neomarinimicrobiota bacterium]
MNTTKTQQSDSPKFRQIVETGTDLFMRYSVKRVTVEEICKIAKVSKMTFYKYFNNKTDLAEYIIFSIFDDATNEFELIWSRNLTLDEKINQFYNLKMKYAKKFSKEFLFDFMNLSPKIRDRVMEYSQKNQLLFLQNIAQAQERGEIRDDISINLMSFMLNNLFDVAEDENFLKMYSNAEDLTLDLMNFYFYGIMGKK